MRRFAIATGLLLLSSSTISAPALATLPDQETYAYITRKYHRLLHEGRDGCAYYADPQSITGDLTTRRTVVLLMSSPNGGSLCEGMFQFQSLTVDCSTHSVTYTDVVGSRSNWLVSRSNDEQVTSTVCQLPFRAEPRSLSR